MSKFCPEHGDPKELPHMVNYCTCSFPINLIGELVAIRPDPAEAEILLPDWKRSLHGTILARGPEVQQVSEGARVSFGAAVGMDSVFNGQPVRILKEQDLDFVYDDEA